MGYSAEKRDKLSTPLCGAMTKRGVPCRAFAGQKTDHLGFGPCAYHGGATTAHKKHALTLEAKQRMVAFSVPVDDAQPHEVLLNELRMSAGHVAFLRSEISALESEEIGGDRSKILLDRFDTERDRLARFAKACSEAGVDEAMIQIETAKMTFVVQAIETAAKEAGLSPRHVQALGTAMRKQLALSSGDEASARAAEERVEQLRSEIDAADADRIYRAARTEAQRLSGLTLPPSEWLASDAT